MKILKIVGIVVCAVMALAGVVNVFSPTEGTSSIQNLIVTLVFLALLALLIWSLIRDRKKTDTMKRSAADQYAQQILSAAEQQAQQVISAAEQQAGDIRAQAEQQADKLRAEAEAQKERALSETSELQGQLEALRAESLVEMTRVDPAYLDSTSDEIKNELAEIRVEQDEMVRFGDAVDASAGMPERVVNTQTKQILRCFNAECSGIIDAVTVKNVDTSRGKIQRSYEALNKLFSSDGVQLTRDYLSLKFKELTAVYSYMLKLEEEKEQKRAIREQMLEEEKVRREIERAKLKIEKEEAQFSNEVKKLMSYMQKAKDDVERQLYLDKIKELEDKLSALQADKENVLQREQNTRAGFVYIISNIGSFGERVFKIGMTRRLEPMDRIAELSSASVPFPFDVHALIFSEDAPGLETVLHQHFEENRVNKVNPRKEFFRVDLDEIKKTVLENHNATVKFVDIPDAVEYRETLKLEQSTE